MNHYSPTPTKRQIDMGDVIETSIEIALTILLCLACPLAIIWATHGRNIWGYALFALIALLSFSAIILICIHKLSERPQVKPRKSLKQD